MANRTYVGVLSSALTGIYPQRFNFQARVEVYGALTSAFMGTGEAEFRFVVSPAQDVRVMKRHRRSPRRFAQELGQAEPELRL